MAMYERIGKTSRDVYDVYFFAKNNWPINRKLVEDRAQMSFKEVLVKCVELLEKMDNRHILDGLGEMLAEPKKDWTRATYLLINYGRHYCPARPHDHAKCPLTRILK